MRSRPPIREIRLFTISERRTPRPEVVLTDLQMPGMTGNELARQLRSLCGPATRLLAMSASAPDDGSDQEFDGFLLKPFTMETFTENNRRQARLARRTESNGATGAAVLDEAVYRKLAGSMRPAQAGTALRAQPHGRRGASCNDATGGFQGR